MLCGARNLAHPPQPKTGTAKASAGCGMKSASFSLISLSSGVSRPDHYLLDIGCGSLRGGVHFVRYLSKGHYCGVEKEKSLLEAGRSVELKRYTLVEKEPQLFKIDDFGLSALPPEVEFDFMLAQSVFTHLTPGAH